MRVLISHLDRLNVLVLALKYIVRWKLFSRHELKSICGGAETSIPAILIFGNLTAKCTVRGIEEVELGHADGTTQTSLEVFHNTSTKFSLFLEWPNEYFVPSPEVCIRLIELATGELNGPARANREITRAIWTRRDNGTLVLELYAVDDELLQRRSIPLDRLRTLNLSLSDIYPAWMLGWVLFTRKGYHGPFFVFWLVAFLILWV